MALTEQESQAAGAAPECLVCPLCMGVAGHRHSRRSAGSDGAAVLVPPWPRTGVSWLEPMEPDLEDDATGSSPEGPGELRGGPPVGRAPVNRAQVDRGDAALPPDPGARRAIGIDIGGTKIAAGVVTAEGRIVERALVATPMGDEPATISAMRGVIGELRERHPSVEAIGVGAAGLVDWPSGRIRWAPHNAYRQLPLRRLLYEATGLPTVVDNDANAAAWAAGWCSTGASTGEAPGSAPRSGT